MLVHELGHLGAARRARVPASELGLGMGPRLFGFQVRGVRYSFCALPVGSFVLLDGSVLQQRTVSQQMFVHLGGISLNLIAGLVTYGTVFGWMNLLLAAGNLLPLYQHDGWKCCVVLMRALLHRKSQRAERVFTFSGGFISLLIVHLLIQAFL
jgi:membrane-associated protease RseP (regulator of RpoE activity)